MDKLSGHPDFIEGQFSAQGKWKGSEPTEMFGVSGDTSLKYKGYAQG